MLGQPIQMNHESAVIKNSKEAEGGGEQTNTNTNTNKHNVSHQKIGERRGAKEIKRRHFNVTAYVCVCVCAYVCVCVCF